MDVKNAGRGDQRFVADGIFFVPETNPENAPQRLGAAGPFAEVARGGRTAYRNEITVAPGTIRRLHLEVFCIDSHRSSPNKGTRFTVAKKRLPKKLRQKISSGAKRILRHNKGEVKRAKGAIQSHMWTTRDEDWIELEGERKNEKAQKTQVQNRGQRRHRQPRRRIEPSQPRLGYDPIQ